MNRLYFLIILGLTVFSLFFIGIYKWRESRKTVTEEQATRHLLSPFKTYISATGVVVAGSENIFIGTPLNRIIEKVLVKVGSKVKKGDVLLKMEAKDLEAELVARHSAYLIAVAKLDKLKAMPRAEDIAAA